MKVACLPQKAAKSQPGALPQNKAFGKVNVAGCKARMQGALADQHSVPGAVHPVSRAPTLVMWLNAASIGPDLVDLVLAPAGRRIVAEEAAPAPNRGEP